MMNRLNEQCGLDIKVRFKEMRNHFKQKNPRNQLSTTFLL